ncbi:PRAME family member 7-like [Thomomys bottae]
MSTTAPCSLQLVAMQSLLSNQSLAISALEDLPRLSFPEFFMEAYAQGHTEVVKAMVKCWPFPCLPLGDLTRPPDLGTMKAVLDGLEMLLATKERPSHWQLQVVELRKVYPNIWTRGYHSMARISHPGLLNARPTGSGRSQSSGEQPLWIFMDLTIDRFQNEWQDYLVQWARKRKQRVQLCSRKLQILTGSASTIQKALLLLRLDSIQELGLSKFSRGGTVKTLAPYLGYMKNLQLLSLSRMSASCYTCSPKDSCKFAAHLGQLHHLQELHLHDVLFSSENMPAILRSLKPLKTFSLSSCLLTEDNLRFLSLCSCTSQLKHLRLRSLLMLHFSPEPLQALLENGTHTLETLALEDCDITDSQLSALLPTLSRCSLLGFFSFYGNRLSVASLHNLLNHTARLSHLTRGIYPAPLESYSVLDWWHRHIHADSWRFAQVRTGLSQMFREMGPNHKVQICTRFDHRTDRGQFYSLAPDGSWVLTQEALPVLSPLPL